MCWSSDLYFEVDVSDFQNRKMHLNTGMLVKAHQARGFTKSLIALLWKVGELLSLPKPSPSISMWNMCGLFLCSRQACYDEIAI